ncbi:hypothetical protein M8C21_017551 [Ambrosia artemisiifolia]|uniref:Wall-associated receptor kinase galacturonan-binding domain-containing protein n=1 Tax=Ambrosia artemisiifolia TaxID=4212 RepID=A0AAD5DBC6_AMBAR|nr:hypothetical protein M8C21_017551 [Ambrosia artemisiifolia]
MNKLYQVYILLILLCLTSEATSAAPEYAKSGCNDTCGTVRIPYPFGIGSNCSVNEWYTVECNSSKPYLPLLNQLQVLGIDLENQTVTVNTPIVSDCNQTNSLDLGRSPFLFSKSQNKFVFDGCGTAVMMDHGSLLTGCSTTCRNGSVSDENNCLGISCCEATIPHHVKSYNLNLTDMERLGGDGACTSALFVDKDSYLEGRFSIRDDNNSYVPISLLWTLSDSDYEQINCCYTSSRLEVDMGNGTSVNSWKCIYSEYRESEGNVYLIDGCQDASYKNEECRRCRSRQGYCYYVPIYGVDGLLAKKNFTCSERFYAGYHESKSSLAVILGVSVSMGVLFLVATIYVLYKVIKKMKERRRRKRFGENRSLATYFMLAMEEGRVLSIFDAVVVKEGTRDDLLALANLAMRCLNMNGKYRPTMKEVAIELETIRTSHVPSTVPTNIKPVMHADEIPMLTYNESSSTVLSFNDSISHE